MALNLDSLSKFDSIPSVSGPYSVNSLLLDTITVAETPFEGVWVPAWMSKLSSVEITGTAISTLSVQLYGTNALAPMNSQAVTVGGSVSAADVNTLTFNSPNLPNGTTTAVYTAVTSDTDTLVAAGLAAAVNANSALAALGVTAKSLAAVITVTWPSAPPPSGAPSFTSPNNPPPQNVLSISGAASPGSETFTVANASSGTAVGSAITSAGLTQLTGAFRYIKARLNTLTGTGASVTAQFQGIG